MVIHNEARGCKTAQIAGARMHIKDAVADMAAEVVVVRMAGCFVPGRLARQANRSRRPVFGHQLEVAVNGSHAHVGHGVSRVLKQLVYGQGSLGRGYGGLQCRPLASKSFHLPIVQEVL